MAEPTPEEWAVLERERHAFFAGDREAWLASVAPGYVADLLPDWPGPVRVEGPEAAWDAYIDFFAQFDSAKFEYVDVEKQGDFTLCDIHSELVGLGSGVAGEVRWAMVLEFDSVAQRHTRACFFHTREEALAWVVSQQAADDRA